MEKRYTIFVSSTYEDFKDQRNEVVKAILELGHIPIGMEMFSAADEDQWQIIKRQIEQSDYYVVIVAHRYGSMAGDVSYTEREYDYATETGVPTLGFILENGAEWPVANVDKDNDICARLDAFKKKVMSKPVGRWTTPGQLNVKVTIALVKQFVSKPRPGWVRTTNVPGPEVVSELARLSLENVVLRDQATFKNDPVFEILFAKLMAVEENTHARMIVLVRYEGSPVYIPAHRIKLELRIDDKSTPHDLKRFTRKSSGLIERFGEDIQINGSGYLDFMSTEHLDPCKKDAPIQLDLRVKLSSETGIVHTVALLGPDWTYGEPGLDVSNLD